MNVLVEELQPQTDTKTIFEISVEPPSDWNAFIEELSAGILFSPDWIGSVSRGYSAGSLYACVRKDGKIKTAIAGIIYDFRFFRMFFSNVPYGGILGELSLSGLLLDNLETELKKRKVHQLRLTRTSEQPCAVSDSFYEKKAFQHALDLRGMTPERLWKQFRKNTRRDVQKARRSGIVIRQIKNAAELPEYYRLYSLTMRRNAALCHYTKKLYQEIEQNLIRSGKASILFADYGGKPVAGMLLLFSTDRTYLIGNVSDPAYLRSCPNDLLYHAALEETLRRGLPVFDFMTSEHADEPLMNYKEKWGASRFPFSIYQKSLSPLHCRLWEIAWAFAASYGRIFLNRAGF